MDMIHLLLLILICYQQEKSNANKFKKEFDRRKKGRKPGQGHHEGQKPRAPRQGEK
jgi:ribosomal protein L19E